MSSSDLLVASSGGHLDELIELTHQLEPAPVQPVWVTTRTVQTESLLTGQRVEWVSAVGSRQGWKALRSLPRALGLIRRHRPDRVISTGAALAVPYLLAARAVGASVHYIESATRLHGPSLSGRILERVPGVRLHHQGFVEPRRGWRSIGGVFDSFAPGPEREPDRADALLMLGTERFPFDRALALLDASPDLLWVAQTGHTPTKSIDPRCRPWLSPDELSALAARSGLIVTHAGVGSILLALRAGHHPVVVPRLHRWGEHADDHQLELAEDLEFRGLVSVLRPDQEPGPVLEAARRRSTVRVRPPALDLG
ncbi:glycosyltransferase [Serinicoccus sediminis]|uniref:glycosyltransferase n=1 Tax=Serinicoccus sediminis TaxID=2306021 RepID=UPI00101EF949|nr:glycosyltransferase [Serinicoccus sediminis]